MVLAAGRGVRMRPLSDVLPKPALPLPLGPVVASALHQAAAVGCRRVVVNAWHLAPAIQEAARHAVPPSVELALSVEDELMDTAGGLALAWARGLLEGRGPVLVINGDGLLDLDLTALAARHCEAGDLVTLALLPHPDPRRWSRVRLRGDGLVDRILPPGEPEHRDRPLLYPGVMLVDRSVIARLAIEPSAVPEMLWRPAMAVGRLGGTRVSGRWSEVGTPRDYLAATLAQLHGGTVVEAGARVAADARLEQAFVTGRSVVESGAAVCRSVIAGGAGVGAGARVEDSVLLGDVRARPGKRISAALRVGPIVA